MNDFLLRDLRDNNKLVYKWQFVEISTDLTQDIRIYYNPHADDNGFTFYAIECNKESDANRWHEDYAGIEVIYHGIAYWDGLRHLYMGHEKSDNYGYDYYPDIYAHIEILKALEPLMDLYCSEFKR
jgi:hypothetical protein